MEAYIVKIGLLQYNTIWENMDSNLSKISEYCEKASKSGVKLLLLPEMSFSGFSMNTKDIASDRQEIIQATQKIAKENDILMGFGWVENAEKDMKERDNNRKCKNHYSVVGKNGIISDYCKIHPFSYSDEDKFFEGGTSLGLFELDGIRFGVAICYDLRFPDLFQLLSENAHVIIVPACWPEKRVEHWKVLLRARAIETQSYILGINCVGDIGGIQYLGESCIVDPNGIVVAVAKMYSEEMLIYDLIDDVDYYRSIFPVRNDRRDDLYEELRNEYTRKI